MKRVVGLLAFLFALAATADEAIFVHERCPENNECRVFLTSDGSEPVSAMAKASMRIDNGNIAAVSLSTDEDDRAFFQINFKDEAAKEFGALTGRNIRQQIYVVVNDRILMAPVVAERIDGGKVHLTAGGNDNLAEQIPWMAARARREQGLGQRLMQWQKDRRRWLYVALAILWLGGSAFFVWRRVNAAAPKPTP